MSQLSREQASALIADIRADNGGISRKDREATPSGVLRALASVRRKLAGPTKILVNNLYSKDTRFIYELIQNAEDNSYAKAIAANEKPSLVFRVYTHKVIIDSNEDGFDESNVKAICSTGESTKADSEGYIGEKDIGFKSVFKVAAKVHVQSYPFSFSFEHMRGAEDDGLGMVTPMNEDFKEIPSVIRTRITLTLHGNVQFEHLLKDFRSIPDTLLLFLRKLQVLTIEIHQPGDAVASVTYSKHDRHENGLSVTSLGKVTQDKFRSSTSEQKFYIVKREVRDLPYDAARVDKKQKSIDHARIILAFPVNKDDVPVLEQQHVFAFLPLRQAGFKFLIQSDFVTQANGEDVVRTPRNEEILAGVAETFRDAALQFCNHPSLCYQWIRYLPSDSISDDFWKSLWTRISTMLMQTKVLRSWSEKSLHFPVQLRMVPLFFYDKSGEPLLPDLKEETYLSRKYLTEDWRTLKPLGTTLLTWPDITDLLRADLESSSSKWKSMSSEADWRTKVCIQLLKAFTTSTDPHINARIEMETMELVPTQNGQWVSPKRLTVYYPDNIVPIPTDLGLRLVHPSAMENPSWQRLLFHLSVAKCPDEMVIKAISQRYSCGVQGGNEANVSLDSSISHLRYLYHYLPKETLVLDQNIWIFNHERKPVSSNEHLYFNDTEEKESLNKLFGKRKDGDVDLPGYSVNFLHPDYIHAVNRSAVWHGKSWPLWLESVAGVRRNPQICSKGSRKLSGEFCYLINYRSEKLLWVLKRYWPVYEDQIDHVEEVLLRSQVQVEPGYREALQETFLPLPKLKHLVEEYCVPEFPFICMSPQPHEGTKEWRFLESLQVGIDDTIHFYIRAVTEIMLANEHGCDSITENAVFRLYHKIQERCNEDLGAVCKYFNSESSLYMPADKGTDAVWTTAKSCVWEGPEWLISKRRLGITPYRGLEALFKTSLQVPDASLYDVLQDLYEMKEEKRGNAIEARTIYDYLWYEFQLSYSEELWKELRETFELVYVSHLDAWFTPSACVWAKPHVEIPGKASIAVDFDSQKRFFMEALMVPEPTSDMHIASLVSQAQNRPAASKIKDTMMLISSLGVTAKDVTTLLGTKIFPVRLPDNHSCFATASPGSTSFEFAIIDNVRHRNAFERRIPFLDFSLEEIRDSREFLVACGLENHFTSMLVHEATDVQGGSLDKEMTEVFRLKANAIVRCAIHYTIAGHRQDPNSLYRLLNGVSVIVSDCISRSMRIRLNGKIVEAERHRASFHLERTESGLYLYLPKDEDDRAVCFEYGLPRKLREFLKIADPGAERALGGVCRQHTPAIIERILDDHGVAPVSISHCTELEEQINSMQLEEERPDEQPVDELPSIQKEEAMSANQERNSPSASPKAAASTQLPVRGAKTIAEEHTNSRTSPSLFSRPSSPPSGNTANSIISPPFCTPDSKPGAVDP